MPKIPRAEQGVSYQPAMMPMSQGDGYEAPGRAMQKLGKGIGDLGGAFAALQGEADKDAEFNDDVAKLKSAHNLDMDLIKYRETFNGDPNTYESGAQSIIDRHMETLRGGLQSRRGQQRFPLYQEQIAGPRRETLAREGMGRRHQKMFGEADSAIAGEFAKLTQYPGGLSDDDYEIALGQARWTAEQVINRMPLDESKKEALRNGLTEQTLKAIQTMPGGPARFMERWLQQNTAETPAPQSTARGMSGGSPMDVAKQFLGTSETGDAKVLSEFFEKAGGQKLNPAQTAWCAAFVNAALGASGQKGTGTLLARDFLKFGTATDRPAEGDIVVLSRGNSSWQGHVGFYAGRDANGNIRVLGGNQGNSVSVKSFPAAHVLGYRKPPEAGTAIPGMDVATGGGGGIRANLTAYAPQAGASNTTSEQGNYLSAKPGPDGKNEVRTLDDFAAGRSKYVTVAGNPQFYGRSYTIPRIEYQDAAGNTKVLENVKAVVHDTGGAFRNAPEGRFDIPVARDVDANVRNANHALWKKVGVEFVPDGQGESQQTKRGVTRYAGLQAPTTTDAGPQPRPLDGEVIPPSQQVAQAAPARRIDGMLTEALLKARPAMMAQQAQMADKMLSEIEKLATDNGYTADPRLIEQTRRVVEATGNPELQQRFALIGPKIQLGQQVVQATERELMDRIQAMRVQMASGTVTPEQVAHVSFLENKLKAVTAGLEKDPYMFAAKSGLLPAPLPALTPAMLGKLTPDQFGQLLVARATAKAAIQMHYQREVPFFQGDEQQVLTAFLKQGGEARLGFLRTMYDALGPDMMNAMKELSKDAPDLATVGWLVAVRGEPGAVNDAMATLQARQQHGYKPPPMKEAEIEKETQRIVGDGSNFAFQGNTASLRHAIEAAKLIYEKRVGTTGKMSTDVIDTKVWEESLRQAMGQNVSRDGKTVYGGIGTVGSNMIGFGGVKTYVPPFVNQRDGLDEIQSKVRIQDLMPAKLNVGAMARGEDYHEVPADGRGRVLTTAQLRGAQLEWRSGSQYALRLRNGDGSYGYAKIAGSDGVDYLLNVGELRPILEHRVKEGTFRPDPSANPAIDMLKRYGAVKDTPAATAKPSGDLDGFKPKFSPGAQPKSQGGP